MKQLQKNQIQTPLIYFCVALFSFSLFISYLRGVDVSSQNVSSDVLTVPKIKYGDPVFSLKVTDVSGSNADIKSIMRPGRWTAVAFVSATCEPCTRLMNQVKSKQHQNFDFISLYCAKRIPILTNLAKISEFTHRDHNSSMFLVTDSTIFDGVRGDSIMPQVFLFTPDGNLDRIFNEIPDRFVDDINKHISLSKSQYSYTVNRKQVSPILSPFINVNNQTVSTKSRFSRSKWVVVTFAKGGCGSCSVRRKELARYHYPVDVENLIIYGSKKEYEIERENNDRLNLESGYGNLQSHIFFKQYPYSIAIWNGFPMFGEDNKSNNDEVFWKRFKSVVDGRVIVNTH